MYYDIYFNTEIENEEKLEAYTRERIERFLPETGIDGSFSLTYVDDEEIHQLNKEYRDIDSPTDILTFAITDGEEFPVFPGEEKEYGDVFISIEAMKRNADEFGVTYAEELERLILHGLLHLSGMDHATNDFKTEPMLILQERILAEGKARK